MIAVDQRWYLDVNRLARSSTWAHGFMTAYDERVLAPVGAGLLVLAALVLAAWWRARRAPGRMSAVLWCVVGALIAFGLAQVLAAVLAKPWPYKVVRHVEVLVPRASGGSYALPNGHAAIAGAVLCGLLLACRWRLAALALLATLLLLFAGVYVGADYPSDMAAGAGLGIAVDLVLWPIGSWLLSPVVSSLSGGPFAWLVVSRAALRNPRRQLFLPRPSTGLPNAKAMDALRAASEAARHAPAQPAPGRTSSVRTTGTTPSAQGGTEGPTLSA